MLNARIKHVWKFMNASCVKLSLEPSFVVDALLLLKECWSFYKYNWQIMPSKNTKLSVDELSSIAWYTQDGRLIPLPYPLLTSILTPKQSKFKDAMTFLDTCSKNKLLAITQVYVALILSRARTHGHSFVLISPLLSFRFVHPIA